MDLDSTPVWKKKCEVTMDTEANEHRDIPTPSSIGHEHPKTRTIRITGNLPVKFSFLMPLLNSDPLPSPDQGDYYLGIQKDLKVVEPKESSQEPKDEIPEVELI
ncbi:hypothetical protein Tco_0389218 [Tanacetum coccineum]